MFEATVNEFPFVKELPKGQKTSVREAFDLVRQYIELTKRDGTLIPLAMVHRVLNVSRQRVHQLITSGRLSSHNFDGFIFVSENALLEFAKSERKTGVHLTEKK